MPFLFIMILLINTLHAKRHRGSEQKTTSNMEIKAYKLLPRELQEVELKYAKRIIKNIFDHYSIPLFVPKM